MTNLDLFIAPLVVGGIAALTLTGNAFERPHKLKRLYLREERAQIKQKILSESNPLIQQEWTVAWSECPKKYSMLFNGKKLGINHFDILEAIVMGLYLLVEFLILFILYNLYNDSSVNFNTICINGSCLLLSTNSIIQNQIGYLIWGYILLCLGLIITSSVFIYSLFKVSGQMRYKCKDKEDIDKNLNIYLAKKTEVYSKAIS